MIEATDRGSGQRAVHQPNPDAFLMRFWRPEPYTAAQPDQVGEP